MTLAQADQILGRGDDSSARLWLIKKTPGPDRVKIMFKA